MAGASMSEEAIRRRTGRGWEEWFDLLDAWGAADRTHTEIARWVAEEHAIDGWNAQAVTVSYERARAGGRSASMPMASRSRLEDRGGARRPTVRCVRRGVDA